MRKRNYTYYVKPLSDNTNQAIADSLNAEGNSAQTLEKRKIVIRGKEVVGVYVVTHQMLTALQHSEIHRKQVRVYVQEGAGEIRPYVLFLRDQRKLTKTTAVRKAADDLRRIKERK
jgi:hypothetical protein